MRTLLLAGTALLALASVLLATGAAAAPITFGYTGGPQNWLVPQDGTYQIAAAGAQGGTGAPFFGRSGGGGLGAEVTADFNIVSGEALRIDVGGRGGGGENFLRDSAGGGGSYTIGAAAAFLEGHNSGDGFVTITQLAGGAPSPEPVPEPGSLALLGTAGLLGLGLGGLTARRRRA